MSDTTGVSNRPTTGDVDVVVQTYHKRTLTAVGYAADDCRVEIRFQYHAFDEPVLAQCQRNDWTWRVKATEITERVEH